MLLSVIIPVYNSEKYVEETVKSVVAQDCKDFEIILINDGSTDGSAALCDSLSQQHKEIKVIHKDNGGVSSARNAGIEAARGKYLTFIDSDDKIGDHMFSDMINEIEQNAADKVFCGFEEIRENEDNRFHIADLPSRQLMNRDEVIKKMLYAGCSGDSYMNSVWGGLYKTEILNKYNLRFENRSMGEDWMFNMKYCDLIQSAVYINQPYYKYLRNAESTTSRYHPLQFEYWITNRRFRGELEAKYDFAIDHKSNDSNWVIKVIFHAIQTINQNTAPNNSIRRMFCHEEFRSALKNTTYVKIKYFIPIIWLLKIKAYRTAESLLRIFAKHIN